MAEAFANAEIHKRGLSLSAESAGLAAFPGSPASPNAIAAVKEAGGDLSNFRSQPLTKKTVRSTEAIYCMTQSHLLQARALFPEDSEKFRLLGKEDVRDPYGGDIEMYRNTMKQIIPAVKEILNRFEERNPQ